MELLDTNGVWSCSYPETAIGFRKSCRKGQKGRDAGKWLFVNTNQKPDESGTMEPSNEPIDTKL